jgi:drug/metabolite transporter (DMT)-like permease
VGLHRPAVRVARPAAGDRRGDPRPVSAWRDRLTLRRGLIAGLLCAVAYGVVLWAQTRAPLAEVAAIRETSVVSGAVIGLVVLGEDFGKRRVAAAAVIAAGILLISM